jgi:hypothetical protein
VSHLRWPGAPAAVGDDGQTGLAALLHCTAWQVKPFVELCPNSAASTAG